MSHSIALWNNILTVIMFTFFTKRQKRNDLVQPVNAIEHGVEAAGMDECQFGKSFIQSLRNDAARGETVVLLLWHDPQAPGVIRGRRRNDGFNVECHFPEFAVFLDDWPPWGIDCAGQKYELTLLIHGQEKSIAYIFFLADSIRCAADVSF